MNAETYNTDDNDYYKQRQTKVIEFLFIKKVKTFLIKTKNGMAF